MKYQIKNIMKVSSFQGQYGMLDKYNMELEGVEGAVELNQKVGSPIPSGEIEGDITEDPKWGKKFKKIQAGFGGGGRFNDPNTRKEIIRQNSLTNAVNYVVAKANLMDKKEALKYMSGKAVIQVATYFAKYSEGLVTVVTESNKKEEPENEPTKQEPQEETPKEDVKEDSGEEDIDLDKIPF